jgi:hypothetical protein
MMEKTMDFSTIASLWFYDTCSKKTSEETGIVFRRLREI